MKIPFSASLYLLIIMFSHLHASGDEPCASLNPEKWELSWADEFDSDGPPNPQIWSTETGYLGYNKELQVYTSSTRNSRVENGRLIIEAHLDEIPEKSFKALSKKLKWAKADLTILDNEEFTSARVISRGKKEFSQARVEARARFTTGRGTWPAIWLLGNHERIRWPDCGELDIMEHVGYDPNRVSSAVHTKDSNFKNGTQSVEALLLSDVWNEFHTYAVEWDEKLIRFFVDDLCYHEIRQGDRKSDDWPFLEDNAYYVILNMAVGGSWGGKEGVDKACFPQRMEVDYVRVFKKG